jgi:hypothetical protein
MTDQDSNIVTESSKEAPKKTEADFYALLSAALRALCLTRDYLGEESLPALPGWEWFDAGNTLASCLSNSTDPIHYEWVDQFHKRVNRHHSLEIRKSFNVGDWVVGIGEHKGCSQVFEGTYCDYQPFSYLDDFDPSNFRLATQEEIVLAKSQ